MSAPPDGNSIPDGDGAPLREVRSRDRAVTDAELAALYDRIDRLESHLESKDAELDAVRRRYEAILERRASRPETDWTADRGRTVDLDGILAYLR